MSTATPIKSGGAKSKTLFKTDHIAARRTRWRCGRAYSISRARGERSSTICALSARVLLLV